MARLSFHWISGRFRTSSLYVVVALVVFGAVIFLLFRGHSGAPSEALAVGTVTDANGAGSRVGSTGGERSAAVPAPGTPAAAPSASPCQMG